MKAGRFCSWEIPLCHILKYGSTAFFFFSTIKNFKMLQGKHLKHGLHCLSRPYVAFGHCWRWQLGLFTDATSAGAQNSLWRWNTEILLKIAFVILFSGCLRTLMKLSSEQHLSLPASTVCSVCPSTLEARESGLLGAPQLYSRLETSLSCMQLRKQTTN